MHRARFTVGCTIGIVAGAASACRESSGPASEGVEGRYVLVAAEGAPLPLRLPSGVPLVAGSLTTLTRDRLLDVREYRNGSVSMVDSSMYAYTVARGRIVVQRPRINPAQTHADTGTVGADAITLRVRYVVALDGAPTSATLVYQRAP